MDNDETIWASAVDRQPVGHTARIADIALLRDLLITCVHIVVVSISNTQIPNKEITQHQAQPADQLSHTHNAPVSTSGL